MAYPWRRRPKPSPVPFRASLDTPLLQFGREYWRIRNACEGVVIFGAPGSGKTSASLAAFLRAYLAAGMGGIFGCAKVDTVDDITHAARATGPSLDLVFIDATEASERFNILEYASRRLGAGSTRGTTPMTTPSNPATSGNSSGSSTGATGAGTIGSASKVTGTTTFAWSCAGSNVGTTASCTAGSRSNGGTCFETSNPKLASSAACFINSIGANTHIATGVANYDTASVDIADLKYLGITHVRDFYNSRNRSVYTALGHAGIRFDFLMYPGGNLTTSDLQSEFSQLNQLEATAPGIVFAVEGANEINNWPVTYNGNAGFQPAVSLQQHIYSMAHSDSSLPRVVVYYFTGYGMNGLPNGPDPFTTPGLADYDNAHPYPQNGMPPLESANTSSCGCLNPLRADALTNETSPTAPAAYTETGYRLTATGEPNSAIFDLEILLDDAQQGIDHTYFYELEEEGTAGDGTSVGLGLFDGYPSAPDTTPSPPATAIHNLTTILADSGSNASTFTPGTLNYSISNSPALGHFLLLEKSTGTFELAVWSEAESNSFPVVSLGGTYGIVNIYDPVQSSTPIKTLSNVSAVPLDLGKDPLIVEIPGAPR